MNTHTENILGFQNDDQLTLLVKELFEFYEDGDLATKKNLSKFVKMHQEHIGIDFNGSTHLLLVSFTTNSAHGA